MSNRSSSMYINIWNHSAFCQVTNLSSVSSVFSHSHFPYAIVRDAVIDRRPSVTRLFRRKCSEGRVLENEAGVKVLLLVKVHNPARLSRDNSVAHIVSNRITPKFSRWRMNTHYMRLHSSYGIRRITKKRT